MYSSLHSYSHRIVYRLIHASKMAVDVGVSLIANSLVQTNTVAIVTMAFFHRGTTEHHVKYAAILLGCSNVSFTLLYRQNWIELK